MNSRSNQIVNKEAQEPGRLERTRNRTVFSPGVDIRETKEELVVYADIPGVPDDKVDITVEKGVLTIRGSVPETEKSGAHSLLLEEFETGDYERAFTLSNEVDQENIRASVKNGVLVIHLPKAGPAKARKIEVSAS
jgi:HSP20 family protein